MDKGIQEYMTSMWLTFRIEGIMSVSSYVKFIWGNHVILDCFLKKKLLYAVDAFLFSKNHGIAKILLKLALINQSINQSINQCFRKESINFHTVWWMHWYIYMYKKSLGFLLLFFCYCNGYCFLVCIIFLVVVVIVW